MSNAALNHVWKHSKAKGSALLVMIAIADMANDEGDCWPGRTNLAEKCRMSKRYLQHITAKLVELGELSIFTNEGASTNTGKTNRYRVEGVNSGSSLDGQRGEQGITPGVNHSSSLEAEGVNHSSSQGVNHSSPDPSLEPSSKTDPIAEPEPARDPVASDSDHSAAAGQHERPNIFKLYEQATGLMLTPMVRDELLALEQEYREAWIEDAFKEMAKAGAKSLNYAKAILHRWKVEGKDKPHETNSIHSRRAVENVRPRRYTQVGSSEEPSPATYLPAEILERRRTYTGPASLRDVSR